MIESLECEYKLINDERKIHNEEDNGDEKVNDNIDSDNSIGESSQVKDNHMVKQIMINIKVNTKLREKLKLIIIVLLYIYY